MRMIDTNPQRLAALQTDSETDYRPAKIFRYVKREMQLALRRRSDLVNPLIFFDGRYAVSAGSQS